METFTRLVDTLVWPLLIGWVFWTLKTEISGLLGRLKSAKYKDFEATFERELRETEKTAIESIKAEPLSISIFALALKDADKYQEVCNLATISARAAIMDAWRELELAAVTAGLNSHVPLTGKRGRVSGIAAIDHLHESKVISPEVKKLYLQLRHLRNQANHAAFEMGIDEAKRYAGISLQFSEWLRDLRPDSAK